MSEPIKAGDLVQIIHQCCGWSSELGEIARVSEITTRYRARCPSCGWADATVPLAAFEDDEGFIPVTWLKRIPPLEELDDVHHEEEITA